LNRLLLLTASCISFNRTLI